MDDDEAMIWQDVLDEIAAGRGQELHCPFCQTGEVAVVRGPERTRVECRTCRRFIEGRFAEGADPAPKAPKA